MLQVPEAKHFPNAHYWNDTVTDAYNVAYRLEQMTVIEKRMEEALNRNCTVTEICALAGEKKVPRV